MYRGKRWTGNNFSFKGGLMLVVPELSHMMG